MIILDTDVLTLVQSRSGTAYENLAKRLDASGEPVYTTIVTYEEQVRGWLARIAALISRNLADFQRIPGLDVQDWTRDES